MHFAASQLNSHFGLIFLTFQLQRGFLYHFGRTTDRVLLVFRLRYRVSAKTLHLDLYCSTSVILSTHFGACLSVTDGSVWSLVLVSSPADLFVWLSFLPWTEVVDSFGPVATEIRSRVQLFVDFVDWLYLCD
jgi:hypothetical protein